MRPGEGGRVAAQHLEAEHVEERRLGIEHLVLAEPRLAVLEERLVHHLHADDVGHLRQLLPHRVGEREKR